MALPNLSSTAERPVRTLPVSTSRLAEFVSTHVLRITLTAIAGALLVVSMSFPYWSITLHAPQYPRGLYIDVYVDHMDPAKNVFEVDNLNHYIGMIKLTDAATVERSISQFAIPAIALLALASFWLKGAWRWLLKLPVILYPAIFVVDLFAWLYYAGHWLDPHAPMSSSISEFTPHIYGKGTIGQFSTQADFSKGFLLAVIAAVMLLVVTLWEQRDRHASRG